MRVDPNAIMSPRHFILEQPQQTPLGEQDGASETSNRDSDDDGLSTWGAFGGLAVAVHAHRGRGPDGAWDGSAPPYYIAVHEACANIAERVAAARPPRPGVRVRSLETLWKVLRTRYDALDSEVMAGTRLTIGPNPPDTYIPMLNCYHMPPPLTDERFLMATADSYYRNWVSKQAVKQ